MLKEFVTPVGSIVFDGEQLSANGMSTHFDPRAWDMHPVRSYMKLAPMQSVGFFSGIASALLPEISFEASLDFAYCFLVEVYDSDKAETRYTIDELVEGLIDFSGSTDTPIGEKRIYLGVNFNKHYEWFGTYEALEALKLFGMRLTNQEYAIEDYRNGMDIR